MVFVLLTIYATTAIGGFYAFTNWTGVGSWKFVGLDNFRNIFKTPELLGSLTNTLLLAFGFLVLSNFIGLGFALSLNRGPQDPLRAPHSDLHAGGDRADRGLLRLEVHLRL